MKKFNQFREDSLLEVLKASDPTGKWIDDFVHSDNPKFAGKSKKERIRMALGAAYASKRNEEVDLEEAIKLGTKVKMHAPGKDYHDSVGSVGEIRHGAYKGAPKTYTVDYGNGKSVQLSKQNVKLHKEEAVAEGSDDLYQKAIRKYALRHAHNYMGGGDEHLHGAKKFNADDFGVSPQQAHKDYKTLFPKYVDQLNGKGSVAEGQNDLGREYGGAYVKGRSDDARMTERLTRQAKAAAAKAGKTFSTSAEYRKWHAQQKEKQGVTEGSIKDIEAKIRTHDQRKADREQAGDPYVAHEIHSHNVIRKQLLDKRKRAQAAYQKKQDVAEAKDKGEYDYEGAMAKTQLQTICRNAADLRDMLEDDENLPEWVQAKITKAEDYITTSLDYMKSSEELGEEVEELDELSKSTLADYAKKASRSATTKRKIAADFENKSTRAKNPGMKQASARLSQDYKEQSWKRHDNVNKAIDRLAKEEVEPIEELNKDTVYSYAKKAEADQDKQFTKIGKALKNNDPKSGNTASHKFTRRSLGINRAETRLNKEDTEVAEARMSAAQRLWNAEKKQRAKSDASLARTPSSIPKPEEKK